MIKNIFFLLFVLLATATWAEDIPVHVKAETLKYLEGTSLIEATGSVEVELKDVKIFADRLLMDEETKIATAEGNVRIFTTNYRAEADYIIYDMTREVSTFSGFSSTMRPRNMHGPLFLSARELDDLGEQMLGAGGSLSTCEDKPQHFFMTADRVEFYPEDKVLGYNVIIHVGELPVFWLPFMYYDLGSQGQRNWVYGHNEVEGDYLKTSWSYPYGVLYLDWMEKKGFGKGTRSPYGLGALGIGTLFLYHLDETDTHITDWVSRIDHTKLLDPWTRLNIRHKYTATYLIPAGRRDQTEFNLNLNHSKDGRWGTSLNTFDDRIAALQKYSGSFNQAREKTSTGYNFYYDFSKRDPKWIRASQRLTHRQPLTDRINLDMRANYYNNVTAEGWAGDEKLEPLVNLTGSDDNFSWRLTENWYIDLDDDTFIGDENYQFLEKQPELEITPRAWHFDWFNVRPKFGYGHYREVRYVAALSGNRDYATERYKATLDLDKNLHLGGGTSMTLGAGLDQYQYTPGDQMHAYRERGSLRTNLFGWFRNNISYRKGSTGGNSPFIFDQIGGFYHDARQRLEFYHKSQFRLSFDGGHNWQTHKWFDVMSRMLVRPNKQFSWDARTGWSIEQTKYKDLVNNFTYTPYSFLSTRFSTVSDMNVGQLRSGSILYDIYFLEGQANEWRLKFSQIYETSTRQFKVRDIMVVKQLHCWQLKYTYSDYRKEFSLTFSLKALPDEPIGMSTGRGFYFDGMEESLEDIKQEGAIKRY